MGAITNKRRQSSPAQLKQHLFLLQSYEFILFGFSSVGWLLCAYAVPKLVWLGILIVTLHLAWAGFYAVVPAFIWTSSIMSVGAINLVWMWSMPIPYFSLVPLMLLLIWILAIGLIFSMALIHTNLCQWRISRIISFFTLILPIWFSLACGVFFYRTFTLPTLL